MKADSDDDLLEEGREALAVPPAVICESVIEFIRIGLQEDLDHEYLIEALHYALGVYLQDRSATIPTHEVLH